MAKLYAELTSDKGGRVASKGGDHKMNIEIFKKNIHTFTIKYVNETLVIQQWKSDTVNIIKENKLT